MINHGIKPYCRLRRTLVHADARTHQRSLTPGKPGKRLNKTSGWVHRATLAAKRVTMLGNVSYERIDDDGLHIRVGDEAQVLAVDTIVICAGQEANRALHTEFVTAGIPVHLIGGADVAAELDAKRAIDQGTRLAATL